MNNDRSYELIYLLERRGPSIHCRSSRVGRLRSGCATYGEALANIQVVSVKWIETAKDLGRPVPEPKSR